MRWFKRRPPLVTAEQMQEPLDALNRAIAEDEKVTARQPEVDQILAYAFEKADPFGKQLYESMKRKTL